MKNITEKNNSVGWISQVAGRKKIYIVILTLIHILQGICSISIALMLKNVVDKAVGGDNEGFLKAGILFVIVIIVQIILSAVGRFLDEYTCATMENRFKERLFSMLLRKDYGEVTAKHSGEWMNRLTSDTVVVADGLSHIIPGITGTLVKLLGALGLIIMFIPKLTYILIPGGIFMVVITYALRKVLKRLHKNVQESDGRLRMFLQENLGSMMVVRAFAKEDKTVDEAAKRMDFHKNSRMKRVSFSNLCNIGLSAMINLLYIISIGYCCYGILNGTITYGTLTAVMQLVGQIQSPLANISGYLPKYYAMIASAERLMEVEGYLEEDADVCGTKEILDLYKNDINSVVINNGVFAYPENKNEIILNGINLAINKGEIIALTGPSGCGKSTILKIFMSLYHLDGGERYISLLRDKMLLNSRYKKLFAYVPQGNHLMSGTIAQVVSFGEDCTEYNEKKIKEALKIACADDFVGELKEGINTVLGERGAGLSEGQMQRIAVARAIYAESPILLLDEATSALDEETEKKLLLNIKKMTEKTVVIVTHRPAALEICDRNIQL